MKLKPLLFALTLPLAIGFSSCDSEEDCETENTGTLTLLNTRSSTITVKVKNTTKTIASDQTGRFENVPSGTCEADITFQGTTMTGVQFSSCVEACQTTELQY